MLLTGSYMLRTLLGTLQASSPLIFMPLLQKPLLSSCKETVLTELHSPKWVAFTLIIADPPFRVHFFREWMSFWGKAAEGVGTFAEVSKLYLLLVPRGRVGPEVWPRNWGFDALILPMGLLLVFLHGLLLALLSPTAPLNSGPFLAFSYSPIFFSLLLPALSEAAFLPVTLFGSTSHIPGLGSLFSFLKNVSVKHSIFLVCIIVLAQRNTV